MRAVPYATRGTVDADMAADPRDDFRVLDDTEHLLFGLDDPFAVLRREVTRYLQQQSPDTEVEQIACRGEPKWLTLTRRTDVGLGTAPAMTVTGFGLCVEATITSGAGYASEQAAATITLLCCRWDQPKRELVRAFVDLGADAGPGFSDEAFQHRLLAFRHEVATGQELR